MYQEDSLIFPVTQLHRIHQVDKRCLSLHQLDLVLMLQVYSRSLDRKDHQVQPIHLVSSIGQAYSFSIMRQWLILLSYQTFPSST
jgi:hypothetical protein